MGTALTRPGVCSKWKFEQCHRRLNTDSCHFTWVLFSSTCNPQLGSRSHKIKTIHIFSLLSLKLNLKVLFCRRLVDRNIWVSAKWQENEWSSIRSGYLEGGLAINWHKTLHSLASPIKTSCLLQVCTWKCHYVHRTNLSFSNIFIQPFSREALKIIQIEFSPKLIKKRSKMLRLVVNWFLFFPLTFLWVK